MKTHTATRYMLSAVLSATLATATLAAAGQSAFNHAVHGFDSPARLIQIVREATAPFVDINVAMTSGRYEPFLGCFSGPQEGAMGIHLVNFGLVGDGRIDASAPEALTYEVADGKARLLGVEYIVDAATWLHDHQTPPVLEGQSFQFIESPNRFGLPAFFELHVWAWKDNPNGAFADWNTAVSCEGQ